MAYVILVYSIAEMSSTLPFAGGAWGLARVTLGFYPGYIIGCCEALEYIAWASVNFIALANILTDDESLKPFLWLLFFGVSFSIHIVGNRLYWPINLFFAALSVALILIYSLGSIQFVDFNKNAPYVDDSGKKQWFVGGITQALKVFPIAAWPYVGIEAVAFACDSVDDPKVVSCVV
jgi:amino acid transporter